MITTDLTKRELAEAIASMLSDLYHRGLEHAVGLTSDGEVDSCFEGGRRLEVVLIAQATDSDNYAGGEMTPDDVAAVADAFERSWLDDHNWQHPEAAIDWAEVSP